MTPLASWLVVACIVFAAITIALFVIYFIGKDEWEDRP